jgi:hypothetical protein
MKSIKDKSKALQLSVQVKNILQEKGFSAIFNFNDYHYFKKQVASAFNKAQAIAELFIAENKTQQNDFSQYIF